MDAQAENPTKTLVLGLGNAMLSDLGAGIELVHRLRRMRPRPTDLDLVRVGLVNVSLAQVVAQYPQLIVVESRPVGGEPGRTVELHGQRMDDFLRQQTGDDAALADILGLLAREGRRPERRALLVIQPGSARVGHGLTRPVAAALPKLVERARSLAADWNDASHPAPCNTATNAELRVGRRTG